MEWYQALLFMVGGFVFLVFLGIPINYSLALSFIPIIYFFSGEPADYVLNLFGITIYRKLQNYGLVAAPLFILMGQVFYLTGTGRRLYDGLSRWMGWLPGGLAVSTICTTTIFAAVCGSSSTSASTLGPISITPMLQHKYSARLAVGSLCSGATLAMLIPPSIPFIFYCIVTEQSIGRLFMAGVIPGLMIAAMFIALTMIRCIKNPSLAPIIKMASLKDRLRAIPWIAGPLGIVFALFGSLYTGLAGINELAAIGVFASIILGLVYRELDIHRMIVALTRTVRILGFFGILVSAACFMGFGFSYFGISAQFTGWIASLTIPRVGIIAIIMVLYFFLGMLMDATPLILVTMPIMFPVIVALDFDPIWFGVILILNLEIGAITPPVGVNLFALKLAVPEVDLKDAIFGSLPYIGLVILSMVILVIFPNLALWLPNSMWK